MKILFLQKNKQRSLSFAVCQSPNHIQVHKLETSIFKLWVESHAVNVHQFGTGSKIAIALHGFADKGSAFQSMADYFGGDYTVLCPDMPFHGATEWNGNDFFPQEIASLIEELLKTRGAQTFTLLGHSMGGRIALHLVELLDGQIEKILLLAPAGIGHRWYYNQWIVPNFVVRALCKLLIRLGGTPWWYTALYKVGFVNGQSYHFFKTQYASPARKARLAGIWRSLCHFPVTPQKSAEILARAGVPLEIWIGERDKIIPPSDAYGFQKLYPATVVRIIAGKNHFLLK